MRSEDYCPGLLASIMPQCYRCCFAILFCSIAAPAIAQRPNTNQDVESLPEGAVTRLGSSRWRHENSTKETLRLAFSDDGRFLVSAGAWRLCVWDARSGRLLKQSRSDNWSSVSELVISPDGKTAAVLGGNGIALAD